LAAAAVHAALGTGGDDKAAETALLTATPDQLLALKKADSDLQVRLKELGSLRRNSLRRYGQCPGHAGLGRTTRPEISSVLRHLRVLRHLGYLIMYGKPQAVAIVMLVWWAHWHGMASIVSFYYGSSAGSAANRDALNRIAVTK